MSSARRWCVWALVLLGGCFEDTFEPPPASGTTSSGCAQGALGCGCYGNGTCDAGLDCLSEVDTCVPEGCSPGELACSCDGGACNSPLVCDQGICKSPGAVPDTDTGSVDTTAGMMTTGPTSTSNPGTTTNVDPTTSTTMPTTLGETTLGLVCDDEPMCSDCISCTDQSVVDCATEYAACDALPGCLTMVSCIRDCVLLGLCGDCCAGMSMIVTDAAYALTICNSDNCFNACTRYEFPNMCP